MKMTDNIRKTVREVMTEKGITQVDLAELVSMERPNVTRILAGRSGKIPDGWQKILDALNLELVVRPKSD